MLSLLTLLGVQALGVAPAPSITSVYTCDTRHHEVLPQSGTGVRTFLRRTPVYHYLNRKNLANPILNPELTLKSKFYV